MIRRLLIIVALVVAAASGYFLSITVAKADVTTDCRADYIKYCSDHEPYTKPGNDCMRSNLKNLTTSCQDALRTKYVSSKRNHVRSTVRKYLRRYGVID